MDRPIVATARGHQLLPHTADAGLRAWAPDLPGLFEEAAAALGELSADIAPHAPRGIAHEIDLAAGDLPALAFAWLGELIGRIDVVGALGATHVAHLARSDGEWHLRASATHLPFDGATVRRRADVKAPTYHRLTVEQSEGAWSMAAFVDI
jgi:SHS2 domain-containing protein